MKPSQELSSFISETNFDDIPNEVFEKSKNLIADGIAVTLAGYSEIGEKILSFIKPLGGEPTSTILGDGYRTNAPMAAYANGTMSHFLDYDDLNQNMGGHPTGPVLSAILALGELVEATGEDLMLAYILGVETETKIGRALLKPLYGSGWHPTAVLGIFGSTAASSKLLNLNADETLMALGIAGSNASGIKQNFGTMIKSLHIGQAAKNGVMAAMLAKNGWAADKHTLEGDFGFCNLLCGRGKYDLKDMTDYLGNPWEIIAPGIQLKKYPCCGSIHSSIDAALDLMKENRLEMEMIERLSCNVHQSKEHILVHPRPNTGLEGKFSLEYCLAAAVSQKKIDFNTFEDKTLKKESIVNFLPRVSTIKDERISQWGSCVTVDTFDGRTFSKECGEFPSIDDWNGIESKFLDCALPVLGVSQSKQVLKMIEDFENLPKTSDFMNMLTPR